ncbi:hypothetical protein KP509_07G087900 [Ceratopteris richardii]|uniref:Protein DETOXIFICATION n=1 Tax=Ceratopteris richardii TaxID=49495 RepID=A0A8T2UCY1_CERRI|nr:hypothetical protein KP509_07G087900 [Ceratopteris richardii]
MCKTTRDVCVESDSRPAASALNIPYTRVQDETLEHIEVACDRGIRGAAWPTCTLMTPPESPRLGDGKDSAGKPMYMDVESGVSMSIITAKSQLPVRCWPSQSEVGEELCRLLRNAMPLILAGLLLYPRGIISMYFLGQLGELELAGGALSIAFANISGYSVLYGLALGMEPICGQAYGARQWNLMAITTKKTIIGLFLASLPIGLLWVNMQRILLLCGQDGNVTEVASLYIIYSIPDLAVHCVLHPLRIYLRSQSITIPLSICAAFALPLHVLANIFLQNFLHMGVKGVALASVLANLNMLMFLVVYLSFSDATGMRRIWSCSGWLFSRKDWQPLLKLAIPSCILICLEWWWYEFMIMLSGLLVEAKATIATMGVLIQVTALVYIFPSSLSLAVSTRVSNELGANRPARARLAVLVASCCAVVLGIMAMAFTTSIRHAWGKMFTKDETVLRLTAMALPIIGLCELGNSPQTTGCGVLRGSARPSLGVKINLASFYVVGMPVSIILVFGLKIGFVGLWLGLLAAQATCAVSMIFVMAKTNWIAEAERSKRLTNLADGEQQAVSLMSEEQDPGLKSSSSVDLYGVNLNARITDAPKTRDTDNYGGFAKFNSQNDDMQSLRISWQSENDDKAVMELKQLGPTETYS